MKKLYLLGLSMLTLASTALAHGTANVEGQSHCGWGLMGGTGMMSGGWFIGWLFMVLVFILLIMAILWLAKELGQPKRKKR